MFTPLNAFVILFNWGWQQARVLVKMVYEGTRGKDFKKDLRLAGQIQTAANS